PWPLAPSGGWPLSKGRLRDGRTSAGFSTGKSFPVAIQPSGGGLSSANHHDPAGHHEPTIDFRARGTRPLGSDPAGSAQGPHTRAFEVLSMRDPNPLQSLRTALGFIARSNLLTDPESLP